MLRETVCSECNDYFGRTLDRLLARGSLEGLQRYLLGVRDPSELDRFSYDAVRLSSEVPGDYNGALLRLVGDAEAPRGARAEPMTQVGFARADGEGFVYFPSREVANGAWKEDAELDWRKGVKIIGPEVEATRALLEAQGVVLSTWREMTAPELDGTEMDVLEKYYLTNDVSRALAKICFNYATHVHGSAFMLQEAFNEVRRFIRDGVAPEFRVVAPRKEDIFPYRSSEDPALAAVFHVVTVTKPLNADVVLGQISLFNWLQWDVVLSPHPVEGLRRSGHVFNPTALEVYELGHR